MPRFYFEKAMLEAGKKIGNYVLIDRLGMGGFGEVWQAEKQTKLSVSSFALKFFRLKDHEKSTLENERREIGIWQKVSGLPNIISIIEADEFEDYIYVVSEFADGGSLEKQIAANGNAPFPVEQAVSMVLAILSGLNSLHQMSFVHRDIKPANILIRRGVYCLADFGISREMKANSKSTQTAGTYEYMSPESFESKPVNVLSDIWAVGVIMQQLLTGKLPFPQTEIPSLIYSILHREPEEMPENIPAGLSNIVRKALEKDPQNRFSSVLEMIKALKYQQMLLERPELGLSLQSSPENPSQPTIDLESSDRYAKSENPINSHISEVPKVYKSAIEAPAIPKPQYFKHPSAKYEILSKPPKKRKIFATAAGSAFFLLLTALVIAGIIYKNTSSLTSNDANTGQTSNIELNIKENPNKFAIANSNNNSAAPAGGSFQIPAQNENTSVNANIEKPRETPSAANPVNVTKPSLGVINRKESASQPKQKTAATPVVGHPTPQPKTNKKNNPDCIFNGDC